MLILNLINRYSGETKNFRLYYDGKHFVGEKRFDTVHDLVADGLIILYLEDHAYDYISLLGNGCAYEDSPYMTLHKAHKSRSRRARKAAKNSNNNKSNLEMKVENINLYDNQQEVEDKDKDKDEEEPSQDSIDVQLFEKKHLFKVHNYMGLPFCDFCGNFMWGLLAQGLKCDGKKNILTKT